MRLTRAWLFAACAGCSFAPGVVPGDMTGDGAPGEGGPDARACFGSGLVRVCFTTMPPAEYATTGSVDFNTDTDCTLSQVQSGGPDLCIKAAQTIRIGHQFDVRGVRPLVLVATTTLVITSSGELDVSSNYTTDIFGNINGQDIGAGEASPEFCGAGTQGSNDAQGDTTTGAGGGAGASLGGTGGVGGAGRSGAGGAGGMPSAPMAVDMFVRGGCRGTPGGNGDANSGGAGGHGGGAVYLIAGTSITIAGRINASGQGGRGGQALSGGGGGGGGGFIGLDSPLVTSSGTVFANGGGGGEGGGSGGTGDYGSSGLSATQRAAGGARDPNGGNGGRGAAGSFIDGEGGQVGTNAGGGGGGGIGVIRVFPLQALGGTVSPAPS